MPLLAFTDSLKQGVKATEHRRILTDSRRQKIICNSGYGWWLVAVGGGGGGGYKKLVTGANFYQEGGSGGGGGGGGCDRLGLAQLTFNHLINQSVLNININ